MSELELIIRAVCCGILFTVGLAMLRTDRSNPVCWTGALFCLATAGFVVQTGGKLADVVGILRHPAWLLSAGGTAYFWLFATTLFADRPMTWVRFLPPLLMTSIIFIGRLLGPDAQIGTESVHNMFEVVLVLHVVYLIRVSAKEDLIDKRRSLRGPFLLCVALFCIILSAFDIAWTLGTREPWIKLSQAIALLALSATGGWAFVLASPALFGRPSTRTAESHPADGMDAVDEAGLSRLRALMANEDFWRQPGLTLAETAKRIALPEYRLRRLINQQLAFRNFPDLVNAQRISQAKRLLADPAQSAEQISSIAFDLGFASLGPFNRAFKAATHVSPREWRYRQALLRTHS